MVRVLAYVDKLSINEVAIQGASGSGYAGVALQGWGR